MKNNSSLDEENTGDALHSTPSATTSWFSLTYLYLGLVLFIVCSTCLAACSANPVCSASALNSACVTSSQTTAAGHSGSKNLPKSSQYTSMVSDKELVLRAVRHYAELVLNRSESAFRKAYGLLAGSLSDQVVYSDFVHNPIYILPKGCWLYYPGRASATRVNSSTWIVVLPLTKVACVSGTTLGLYIWLFRLGMVYGLYEIVAVTLERKNS